MPAAAPVYRSVGGWMAGWPLTWWCCLLLSVGVFQALLDDVSAVEAVLSADMEALELVQREQAILARLEQLEAGEGEEGQQQGGSSGSSSSNQEESERLWAQLEEVSAATKQQQPSRSVDERTGGQARQPGREGGRADDQEGGNA